MGADVTNQPGQEGKEGDADQTEKQDAGKHREEESPKTEGLAPRFQDGTEDLDQLEGIEHQLERSRRARHKQEQQIGDDEPVDYPLIDSIEKSRQRLRNRFRKIKDFGDAQDEFGS